MTQGVIAKTFSATIPQAVQTFQSLAGNHLLAMPPKIGFSGISDLVAPILTGAGQPAQFAALLAAHAGDWATLWSAATTAFGAATVQKLQLAGQLSYLTLDNAPVLAALNKAEAQTPLTAPIDLATRGYWDPAKWTPLVAQSVPPSVPGATAHDKATNYAGWLTAQVRLSFPTATLAQKVKSGAIPLAAAQAPAAETAAATEAATFLATHQADLAFGVEPVESYIARNKLNPSGAAVFHLKRLQRVYQMTTSDQALSALLTGNADFGLCHHPLRFRRLRPRLLGQRRRRRCGARDPQPRDANPRRDAQCRDDLRHAAGFPGTRRQRGDDLAGGTE